jgi:hypothetical protein
MFGCNLAYPRFLTTATRIRAANMIARVMIPAFVFGIEILFSMTI